MIAEKRNDTSVQSKTERRFEISAPYFGPEFVLEKRSGGNGEHIPNAGAAAQLGQIVHILAHNDETLDKVDGKVDIFLRAVWLIYKSVGIFP